MRNRTLVMGLALPLCVALSSMTFAAKTTAKPAAKPAAKAAKPAAKTAKPAVKTANPADKATTPAMFDQKVVMEKFWKGPDSAVVGSVDGVNVTKGELIKALWEMNAPNALDELLKQKMIEQASKKSGASLSKAEVDTQISDSLKKMNMTSVDQLLSQYKITYPRFINTIKTSALAQKIVQGKITVTDAEYAEFLKAQQILVRFPQDVTDKAQQEEIAKKKIDEVAQRIKNGEDFSSVAKEVSEDPGSAQNGGDLGWFTKGRMVAEFENAAFELKAGQVSEPVKTFYGFHIIKAEKLGRSATAAEKSELKKQILDKKLPPMMGQWFQELQNNAKMDNKLMGPQEPKPQPAMAPQQPGNRPAAPKVAPPQSAPKPAPKPAPQPVAPKAEPATGDKPEAPPPPPPAN